MTKDKKLSIDEILHERDQRRFDERLAKALNLICQRCHEASLTAGWWRDTDTFDPHIVPTKLMLTVSELAEAMEGDRKGLMDDHLPQRTMMEVELADAVIRICDLAGWLGYDLGGALVEKLAYNKQRADHKLEARASEGGKAY